MLHPAACYDWRWVLKFRSLAWRAASLALVLSCRDDITAPSNGSVRPHAPAMAEAVAGISPAVSAGGLHTCVLANDASARCWGYNEFGQTSLPTGLGNLSEVSAGNLHTCALTTTGAVACWGSNQFGQITIPNDLGSVTQVSAANYSTWALKTDGTVACWGTPGLQTGVPAGLSSVSRIATGTYHTCALRTDATLVCWGYNIYGQSTVPTDLAPVTQVSLGD